MVLTPVEGGLGETRQYEVLDTLALPFYVAPLALRPFIPQIKFAIYYPFDPNKPVLTSNVMNRWPYKDYQVSDGKIRAYYSPNVHRIMLSRYTRKDKTGTYITAIPVLLVDYGTPIRAIYYGPTRPPERDLNLQYGDWKSGYMMARVKSPSKTITVKTTDPCATKSARFGCLPKTITVELVYPSGHYWVQYKARLLELPAQLLTLDRDVLVFTYERPGEPGLVDKIYDAWKHKLEKDAPRIVSILNSFGLELDESIAYEYGGQIYRGIKVFVSEDGKTYKVFIPVRRKPQAQFPWVAIIAAVTIIGALLIIRDMVFMWSKVETMRTRVEQDKIYITREALEQLNEYMNTIQNMDIPDEKKAELMSQVLTYYGKVVQSLAKDPSGQSLMQEILPIIKYGLIAGTVLLLSLIGLKVAKSAKSLVEG